MTEHLRDREELSLELKRAMTGDAWHGPALSQLLLGVTSGEAAAHPIPGAHSIWEIVLHLTAWAREVRRRIQGGTPAEPSDGDWPPVSVQTASAWERARLELAAAHDELIAEVHNLPAGRLDHLVGVEPPTSPDTRITVRHTLHGTAQHDAYHGGQIALLKKALVRRGTNAA